MCTERQWSWATALTQAVAEHFTVSPAQGVRYLSLARQAAGSDRTKPRSEGESHERIELPWVRWRPIRLVIDRSGWCRSVIIMPDWG